MLLIFDKWANISQELSTYFFRNACGFTPIPNEKNFKKLIGKKKSSVDILFNKNDTNKLENLDLSVSSKWLSSDLINDISSFEKKINQKPFSTFFGGYLETRAVYDSSDYEILTERVF